MPDMSATPATPSASLPKSRHQQSVVATSSIQTLKVPVQDFPDITPALDERDVPSFSYPDHVIPPRDYARFSNLIIVCCHAIFHPDVSDPSFPLNSPYEEGNWHLASFQRADAKTGKPGEHETFLAHISAAIDTLKWGSWGQDSLLCFSGGATKTALTPLTEARSYYNASLSQAMYHGHRAGGYAKELFDQGRILLEEHATDSFQNLLFSILLFRQTTGRYPEDIRIITHAFKARRFLDLHAPAIKWPSHRLRVKGIDPVMSRQEHEETVEGEARMGYAPWQDDAFGVGETLGRKRRQRGWDEGVSKILAHGLEDSIQQLLEGEKPTTFRGPQVTAWTERRQPHLTGERYLRYQLSRQFSPQTLANLNKETSVKEPVRSSG